MKIFHLNAVRKLTPGQQNQLTYEYISKNKLSNIKWVIVVFCDVLTGKEFEIQVPRILRNNLGRKLYLWLWSLKNISPTKDVFLQRYSPADIFSLVFGWYFRNRYLLHHSIEVSELRAVNKGIIQKLRILTEKLCSKINSYNIKGHFSASNEIKQYYQLKDKNIKIHGNYFNGIDSNNFKVLEDKRDPIIENIVFVASSFSTWHGLDLILRQLSLIKADESFELHLIGTVFADDMIKIVNLEKLGHKINTHGNLKKDKLRDVLALCDVGLSSFALDRKDMKEATTLKVREYLAGGLAVYSGHIDSAFSSNTDFYMFGSCNISEIRKFAKFSKCSSRESVRSGSAQYIEKINQMKGLVGGIENSHPI